MKLATLLSIMTLSLLVVVSGATAYPLGFQLVEKKPAENPGDGPSGTAVARAPGGQALFTFMSTGPDIPSETQLYSNNDENLLGTLVSVNKPFSGPVGPDENMILGTGDTETPQFIAFGSGGSLRGDFFSGTGSGGGGGGGGGGEGTRTSNIPDEIIDPQKDDYEEDDKEKYQYPDDQPPPVPEPATLVLLGAGLIGLALYRRK